MLLFFLSKSDLVECLIFFSTCQLTFPATDPTQHNRLFAGDPNMNRGCKSLPQRHKSLHDQVSECLQVFGALISTRHQRSHHKGKCVADFMSKKNNVNPQENNNVNPHKLCSNFGKSRFFFARNASGRK